MKCLGSCSEVLCYILGCELRNRPCEKTTMPTINDACQFLDELAPTRLAEDWDNVGLLVGDRNDSLQKVMTCLTVTPDSAAEAIDRGCQLIVSHHPVLFRATKRITTDATPTRLLWDLIRAGVAIYSPHTGFDSAAGGINQSLCEKLGLKDISPLVPIPDDPDSLGAGRIGTLGETTLREFVELAKKQFGLDGLHIVGDMDQKISKVASACGSGGSFLGKAVARGCDCFVTGESTFHTCLEAESHGVSLVLLGHYASERFAVEMLAKKIDEKFPDLEVWASEKEADPLQWV